MYEIHLDVCKLKITDKPDKVVIEIPSTTYISSFNQLKQNYKNAKKNLSAKKDKGNSAESGNLQNDQTASGLTSSPERNKTNSTSNTP
jgi:hypothetical protein